MPQAQAQPFESSREHLLAELERLDLLLRLQSIRARQLVGDDSYRGLTITDSDLAALFERPLGAAHWQAAPLAEELSPWLARLAALEAALEARLAATPQATSTLRLLRLGELFGLGRFDREVLLLSLMPEIDLRYERLFAWLNDDVTRKRPAVDTALSLFARGLHERLTLRARLSADAPLRRHGLIEVLGDGGGSTLGQSLRADERIVSFLLGGDELEPRLLGSARLVPVEPAARPLPEALTSELGRLGDSGVRAPLFHLMGPEGTERRETVQGLAAALSLPLLWLEGSALEPLPESEAAMLVQLAVREATLQGALLAWRDFDASVQREGRLRPRLVRPLEERSLPVLLSGEGSVALPAALQPGLVQVRLGSVPLSAMARRIVSQSRWSDLVLPEPLLLRLHEITAHARHRDRVFRDWGFDRKLATGKGLTMLFTGAPGTGKTMAAGIMARELGLELFQIDLSSLVSKFIGETEKQLSRLFAEAERSGAVLFFDEADALFGKRSEVRDSHDRYANLETSYLLQRIDAYEGVVILASNFSRNLDEAFVRRFQFIVPFPAPSEEERRRIWERIWPDDLPRAQDLALETFARRFELSGGHIRNIAVAAAFLAASEGKKVERSHLFHATRREYQKLGRRIDESLFR